MFVLGKEPKKDPVLQALLSLKNDLEETKKELEDTREQLKTLLNRVETAETKLNNLDKAIAQLEATTNTTGTKLEKLETELTNIRSSVIPALSREIEKLRSELNEAKRGKLVQLVILPKDEAKRLIDELIG